MHHVAPDQITAVRLIKDNNAIIIKWRNAPDSNQVIQFYDIEYKVNGSNIWKSKNIYPFYLYTKLGNLGIGITYLVRVRAISFYGFGKWSDIASITL